MRSAPSCLALAGAALLAASTTASALPGQPRILVLSPEGVDIDASDLTELPGVIVGILEKYGDHDNVVGDEAAQLLNEAKKKVPGCLHDETCVAGMAREAHADVALVTVVTKNGSRGFLLDLLEVNASGAPPRRHSETMKKKQSLPLNLEICTKAVLDMKDPDSAAPPASASSGKVAPGTMEVMMAPMPAPPTPAVAPAASDPKVRKRVMVLDLVATGVDAKTAAPLAEFVAHEISLHGGFDVASADDVRRMMSQQADKEAVGCTKDEACLVEISKKLQADFIVNGSVGQIGSSFVINLALMNPKEMSKASGASETVSRLEDLPDAAKRCTARIFKWAAGAGPAKQAYHLPTGKKMSFAVMDLKPTGISISSAQNLTQVLSVEVKGVEGASVIGREDITAMLQLSAAKIQVGCGDDSCMSEIGGALGVDRLIAGDVGKIGESYIVNLRLIDVRHGLVENRVTESYRGDEDQLLRAVRHSGRELLGLQADGQGKIAVTASQNGATVFVDDLKKGLTPIPIDGLKVGRHDVRVAHDGWYDWHSEVYVDPLETTSVWALLKERPQAWYQKWWLWTIVGVVVAGGTTAAVLSSRPAPTTGHGEVNVQ